MNSKPPTYPEISKALQPWFPAFSSVFQSAEEAQLYAIGILGIPRKGERAGDFHRALRTGFRSWCDETNGIFQSVEEDDGMGLDCLTCHLIDDKPFAIRTGRFNGKIVKRNNSIRQCAARKYGELSSEMIYPDMDAPELGSLRQVSLVYTIQNEGTAGGRPAWYMNSLLLVKELTDGVGHLARVDSYSPPSSIAEDQRRAVAVPREEELELWRRLIGDAQKHG